ncbi:hypothetical protein JOC33_003028 [Thalassobacillus pellis]|nr:hypothetical protein [Thalassobacillus pellis]
MKAASFTCVVCRNQLKGPISAVQKKLAENRLRLPASLTLLFILLRTEPWNTG